ncbi:phage tail protein [Pseudochrobactrum lubricantis]|uniref:phage tail protein n=1 Tax=Pseudochrobactrum lubricantis TaxID=558172 RepID=UPI0035DD476D
MPVKDYSTTPSNNTAINRINIAEGCAPSNINNAIRQLMADLADKQALKAFLNVVIGTDVQAYDPKLYNMVVPVGGTIEWNGDTEPEGWMFEDGRALSRTTYPALFAVLGTKWGAGNGTTTFNIPDSRGRVVAGINRGTGRLTAAYGGVDGDVLGAVGGSQTHVLTEAQMPSHRHEGNTNQSGRHWHHYTGAATNVNYGGDRPSGTGGNSKSATDEAGEHSHYVETNYKGGNQPHNNVQPTIIKNKIIRVL